MRKEPTEKEIENSILDYLKTQEGFFWKNQSVGIWDNAKKTYRRSNNRHHLNGVADILGVLPGGYFCAIEVKSKRGKTTEAQDSFLQMVSNINREGKAKAFVARSIEDVQRELYGMQTKSDKEVSK